MALAVGAQDVVSDADWTLLRATGTSHPVAIYGLHIGFVAGLAALLSGGLWRRVRWRGLPAPLIVSAQKAAAAGAAIFAAFYAALAGFNVPAQRLMWMPVFRRARGTERPAACVFARACMGAGAARRSVGRDRSGILAVVLRRGGNPVRDCVAGTAHERGSALLRCVAGQRWQWDGVVFDVLWPQAGPLAPKPNATSCVLKVTSAAGRSALLAADIEADVERQLLQLGQGDAAWLQADVLVVPHHGGKTSSTEPFLDAVKPRVAVFQVGYRNRFNHPNPTVFERYRLRDIELSRSDEDGAARMDVAAEVSIERFRQTHARYWMGR